MYVIISGKHVYCLIYLLYTTLAILTISHHQIILFPDWINDYTFGICSITDDFCRYNSNCHQSIIYALQYTYWLLYILHIYIYTQHIFKYKWVNELDIVLQYGYMINGIIGNNDHEIRHSSVTLNGIKQNTTPYYIHITYFFTYTYNVILIIIPCYSNCFI